MKKLIAIIPARGGSKRLKNKNIYPLLNKPLIAYSIKACQASAYVSDVFVSSDSRAILEVSESFGAKSIQRNSRLSDDETPKIIAVRDVVAKLEVLFEFDDVAIIQANSPEITSKHIDGAYEMMNKFGLWEVMSADQNGVQNAAIRIVKKEVLFQEFLSAHCGFYSCNLMDVHTIEDVLELERRMS